jgi:hypothetical protein
MMETMTTLARISLKYLRRNYIAVLSPAGAEAVRLVASRVDGLGA